MGEVNRPGTPCPAPDLPPLGPPSPERRLPVLGMCVEQVVECVCGEPLPPRPAESDALEASGEVAADA